MEKTDVINPENQTIEINRILIIKVLHELNSDTATLIYVNGELIIYDNTLKNCSCYMLNTFKINTEFISDIEFGCKEMIRILSRFNTIDITISFSPDRSPPVLKIYSNLQPTIVSYLAVTVIQNI